MRKGKVEAIHEEEIARLGVGAVEQTLPVVGNDEMVHRNHRIHLLSVAICRTDGKETHKDK